MSIEVPRGKPDNENQGCRYLAVWVSVGIPVQVCLTLINYALLTRFGLQEAAVSAGVATAAAYPGAKIITDALTSRIRK